MRKDFLMNLVAMIPDYLKDAAEELCESGMIEHFADGYLLTKKGRDQFDYSI